MEIESLGYKVLGLAIEVHKNLGPGLLESAYESCLAEELVTNGINFKTQVPLDIQYKGKAIEVGFRMDMLIDDRIVLELKCVEAIKPIHLAQILTYLRMSKLSLGYIINFNTTTLMNGVQRVVNDHNL